MAAPNSGSSAHPLRPYYTDDGATFTATPYRMGNASTSASTAGTARSGWDGATSSKTNTIIHAPTSNISNRYASATSALDDENVVKSGSYYTQLSDVTSALVYSAGLQYASTCLAMPFEVGKLLLQVQWVPKDEVWMAFGELDRLEESRELKASRERQRKARKSAALGSSSTDRVPLGRNEWNEGELEPQNTNEDDEDFSTLSTSEEMESFDGEGGEEEEIDGNEVKPGGSRDFGGENDELSDEDDAEAYFRDLSNTSSRPVNIRSLSQRKKRKQTDSYGYVMRRSIHEELTRPEFVMPVVVKGGVWEMIKAVWRGKEGWFGLWKGSFTTFVIDVATSTIQPIVCGILAMGAPSALTVLPLPYAPHPYRSLSLLAASHLLTGIIISPLDLVRTRLIAQSTLPAHRKYTTPWNALSQIHSEEGGWKTMYLHPNLFIPTLLDYSFRPLLTLSAPLLIEHNFRLDPITNPVSYSLAEFCIASASLLITLPIETVRRRLQLQSRARWSQTKIKVKESDGRTEQKVTSLQFTGVSGTVLSPLLSRPLRTCVETRPRPYLGVVEAIWRIITEESSASPVKKLAATKTTLSSQTPISMEDSGILAKQGHSSLGGLYSLYRGFNFAIGANALVFVLTVVTGERASSTAGWAEI